jgi:hypothetical protein
MSLSRKINKSKRGLRKAPKSDLGEDLNTDERAIMHELDISALMPEPQGSGEASEESGVNIKNSENSPAIAQGSTSLEPLAGELLGDAPGAEDEAPQQFGPKRLREAEMTSEAVICGYVSSAARSGLAHATPSFHCHLTIM